jgi:hypothetical protein
MMPNDFDPYDVIMQMTDRILRLEIAHNKLVEGLHKTDKELNIALHALRHLQQEHINLSSTFSRYVIDQEEAAKN